MSYQVNWDTMTVAEAQQLADALASAFSLTAKCIGCEGVRDVSYLTVESVYDDQLHSEIS